MLPAAAFAVAVLCMPSACSGDDRDEAAPVTYRSPIYGYAIAVPPRWTAVDAERALAADELPTTSTGATDILGEDASTLVGGK